MKRKTVNRPISYLSLFASAINGDLLATREQYQTLLPAKDKPAVLNDEIVNRIIQIHEEKKQFIENYERQFNKWKEENLTPNQLIVLEDLEAKLPLLKEINDKVLELVYQIKPYTIDKIMAMNPEELAVLHLSGKLKL